MIIRYHLAGHHPGVVGERRARERWFTTKRHPSYTDMIIKLRRMLIAAQFLPEVADQPTPEESPGGTPGLGRRRGLTAKHGGTRKDSRFRTFVLYGRWVELVGRWWNGVWGRMARRDIWLYKDGSRWLVRAREGTADSGRDLVWPPFPNEWSARAWVDRLKTESPGGRGGWRDLTRLVSKPAEDR